MSSPAVSRLDASKISGADGVTATANIATSTNPSENASATAANEIHQNPSLVHKEPAVASSANAIEDAKQLAAFTAVDQHILTHHKVSDSEHSDMHIDRVQVIGIGSGW